MAIGANASTVLGMVMRQGLLLAAIGATAGMILAAVAAQAMSGALYGVGAFDPVAWLTALAVLFTAALLANFFPARRAMQINPVTALRTE